MFIVVTNTVFIITLTNTLLIPGITNQHDTVLVIEFISELPRQCKILVIA